MLKELRRTSTRFLAQDEFLLYAAVEIKIMKGKNLNGQWGFFGKYDEFRVNIKTFAYSP